MSFRGNEKDKRRYELSKNNFATQMAATDLKRKLKMSCQESEDTTRRKKVNMEITKSISEGKNKEEILEELLSNPEYTCYKQYFEGWVSDKWEKANKKEKTDDYER